MSGTWTGEHPVGPRELADWLLARGRHWVTTSEAAALLEIPEAHVSPTLARWQQQGRLFSPTKGLYVLIPAEFRLWGAVPAAHFIDPLMRHLGHPYYVCRLSAAEVHGYAHQRPQVFQVMTTARLRDRTFGRVGIEFSISRHAGERPAVEVNTPTGTMRVSTPETTVLDLVARPSESGALSNVATIIGEMLDDGALDIAQLSTVAMGYPTSVVQRTGWLIDFMAGYMGVGADTDTLHELANPNRAVLLDPSGTRDGPTDERWDVIVNEDIQPES
jgi:predicted transcriptional regulator of viral defense system